MSVPALGVFLTLRHAKLNIKIWRFCLFPGVVLIFHPSHSQVPHTLAIGPIGGVFAQRAHSTNYYVVHPGNTPANHPPTEACMIHSKQHRGCRIQDPGTRGKDQTKTKNPWCTSRL